MAKTFLATLTFRMSDTATEAQAAEEMARMLRNNFGTEAHLAGCDEQPASKSRAFACSHGVPGCFGDTPGGFHVGSGHRSSY